MKKKPPVNPSTEGWDPSRVRRFERAWRKASKSGQESFQFDGDLYFISHAGYVIRHLRQALNMK